MIQDSKLLSSRQLEKAAAWIKENSWYAYGIVHNRAIDQHNIWQSTLLGMQTAIINLLAHCPQLPATILVDAMPLNLEKTVYSTIPIHSMIRGEQESISIAAASILAKVKRDEMMRRYDTIFPGFSFGDHKGYATAVHLEALQAQEQTIIHRNSFLKKFNMRKLLAQKELQNQQISLFDPISTPTQEALLSSPSYPTPIKIKQTRVQK